MDVTWWISSWLSSNTTIWLHFVNKLIYALSHDRMCITLSSIVVCSWHVSRVLHRNSVECALLSIIIYLAMRLTDWDRGTHICVNIGSGKDLSPAQHQSIIWTNAGILLIGPLGTNFSEIYSKFIYLHSRQRIWICRLQNGVHLVSASTCYEIWTWFSFWCVCCYLLGWLMHDCVNEVRGVDIGDNVGIWNVLCERFWHQW